MCSQVAAFGAIPIELHAAGGEEIFVRLQSGDKAGDEIRIETHVVVDEEQKLAGGDRRASVHRRSQAYIVSERQPVSAKTLSHCDGVVGRVVVHHDDFVGPMGLTGEARETGPKMVGAVPVDDDDRNCGVGSHARKLNRPG